MLQTTSEELASPREDLSIARKEELQRLLLDQVPAVLSIITRKSKFSLVIKNAPSSPKDIGELLGTYKTVYVTIQVLDRSQESAVAVCMECFFASWTRRNQNGSKIKIFNH